MKKEDLKCAACGLPLDLSVRTEDIADNPDALYYCDRPDCVANRQRRDWEDGNKADQLESIEDDYELDLEQIEVIVKPSGPRAGKKINPQPVFIKPGSTFDRHLIRLGVSSEVRARITPEMAKHMTTAKSVTDESLGKAIISSSDRDPGATRKGDRKLSRKQLEKEASDTDARRKAGIYDPVLEEKDKRLHFDECAFGPQNRADISSVFQDLGGDPTFIDTDGSRSVIPWWIESKLDEFFRKRLEFVYDDRPEMLDKMVSTAALDKNILVLYYKEGLEDKEIFKTMKAAFRTEGKGRTKYTSSIDAVKFRRLRLIKQGNLLYPPQHPQRTVGSWLSFLVEYSYRDMDGKTQISHFGFTTADLTSTQDEIIERAARPRCLHLFGVPLNEVLKVDERTFPSKELALQYMKQNNMILIPPGK